MRGILPKSMYNTTRNCPNMFPPSFLGSLRNTSSLCWSGPAASPELFPVRCSQTAVHTYLVQELSLLLVLLSTLSFLLKLWTSQGLSGEAGLK